MKNVRTNFAAWIPIAEQIDYCFETKVFSIIFFKCLPAMNKGFTIRIDFHTGEPRRDTYFTCRACRIVTVAINSVFNIKTFKNIFYMLDFLFRFAFG